VGEEKGREEDHLRRETTKHETGDRRGTEKAEARRKVRREQSRKFINKRHKASSTLVTGLLALFEHEGRVVVALPLLRPRLAVRVEIVALVVAVGIDREDHEPRGVLTEGRVLGGLAAGLVVAIVPPVEDEWLDRCRSLPWLASLYRRISEAPDVVITWRDRTFTDVSSLERFVRDDERDDSRGRACD